MRIHVQKGFGTHGPFSPEQFQELLERKVYDECDLAWEEGTEDWIPISQIKAKVSSSLKLHTQKEGSQIRPWVRLWARIIDYNFYRIVTGIALKKMFSGKLPFILPADSTSELMVAFNSLTWAAMIIVFVGLSWIPIEAFMLSVFRKTLGKFLLRVEVRNQDKTRLSFAQALRRTINVWIEGEGLWLFPFFLIAHFRSYLTLTGKGITHWDGAERFVVIHRKVGPLNVLLAVCLLIAFSGFDIIESLTPDVMGIIMTLSNTL